MYSFQSGNYVILSVPCNNLETIMEFLKIFLYIGPISSVLTESRKLEKVWKFEKILERMEKVWKIEQMSGKSLDFLGLTSGDKKVHKQPLISLKQLSRNTYWLNLKCDPKISTVTSKIVKIRTRNTGNRNGIRL